MVSSSSVLSSSKEGEIYSSVMYTHVGSIPAFEGIVPKIRKNSNQDSKAGNTKFNYLPKHNCNAVNRGR